MAQNRLEGKDFINPQFFDDLIKGATTSLELIKEIQSTLKSGLSANSKKISLMTPDSVESVKEFNNLVQNSEQAIKGLTTAEKKEYEIRKLIADARKKEAQAEKASIQTQQSKIRLSEQQVRVKNRERREVEKATRALQKEARELEKANSIYHKIQAQVTHLTKVYNDLATKREMGITLTAKEEQSLENLETKLAQYNKVLLNVDKRIGKHQRNVGNYKSGFDGLGFSVAQISREMPAFANSMQTGFMAISNNIPMLVDQINMLRRSNAKLMAQGEPTTSVFKSLGKAIFGWQSLISIGVTLLTVYGAKMISFIANSGKSAEEMEKEKEAQERLNEKREQGARAIASETSKLDVLFGALKKTNNGSKERELLINKINATYGTTLKNLQDEKKFVESVALAYEQVSENILKKATFNVISKELEDVETKLRVLTETKKEAFRDWEGLFKIRDKTKEQVKQEKEAYEKLSAIYNEMTPIEIKRGELLEEAVQLRKELIKTLDAEATKVEKAEKKKTKATKKRSASEIIADKKRKKTFNDMQKEAEYNEKRVKTQQEVTDGLGKEEAEREKQRLLDFKKKEDDKLKKAKESADAFIRIQEGITQATKDNSDQRIRALEREAETARSRAEQLSAIASQGNLEAKESIAQLEKQEAQANRKKEAELKRQKQLEAGLAILKTYTAELGTGATPAQALANTVKNGAILSSLISALPSFYEGTENTTGGNLDNKGGFLSVLHPNERVVPQKYNKYLSGITNAELPNAVSLYEGLMKPNFKYKSSTLNDPLLAEMQGVKKAVQSLDFPKETVSFDQVEGVLHRVVRHRNVTTRTERRVRKW